MSIQVTMGCQLIEGTKTARLFFKTDDGDAEGEITVDTEKWSLENLAQLVEYWAEGIRTNGNPPGVTIRSKETDA